jgi:hypothetical protein
VAQVSSDTARLAIVLGAVLPGVGHLYIGKIKRGVYIILLLLVAGTVSTASFSLLYALFTNLQDVPNLLNTISTVLVLIPIIVWVLQIRDLRGIIKKKIGYTIDELEPPHTEIKTDNPNDGTVCPGCGKQINKESKFCKNCGFYNL